MTSATALDDQPWFRQFWPWFLIAIPAATVCACMYTIWLAISTSDSLVVEKGRGVDVQTDAFLAAEARASDAGISADLVMDSNTGAVIIALKNAPETAENLSVIFSHPTIRNRDFSLELSSMHDASRLTAFLPRRISGRWYVSLQDNAQWRISGILDDSGRARLNAEGTGR